MLSEVVINFASNDSALFKVKAIQTFFIFILISIFMLFLLLVCENHGMFESFLIFCHLISASTATAAAPSTTIAAII